MKSIILSISLLFSAMCSAEVFGDYDRWSRYDFIDNGKLPSSQAMIVSAVERGTPKLSYLCTDTSSRKVAGKIIDRQCWVEWRGQRYANDNFYVLNKGNYEWLPITNKSPNSVNARILADGVTNGGTDEGNFVFHCKIISQTGDLYFETHGKYIPSRNGCYYEYFGARFAPISQPGMGLYEPLQDMYVLVQK